MRLIDVDKLVLNYGGLSNINPYDVIAITRYFYDQIKAIPPINIPLMKWVNVKDKLPEPETEVLVMAVDNMGYATITTAMYEDGTKRTEDSKWVWDNYCAFEYDEERDTYIVSEGWWEHRHYNPDDVYNNPVDDHVTHWMPLPEPPKEG